MISETRDLNKSFSTTQESKNDKEKTIQSKRPELPTHYLTQKKKKIEQEDEVERFFN